MPGGSVICFGDERQAKPGSFSHFYGGKGIASAFQRGCLKGQRLAWHILQRSRFRDWLLPQ